MFDPVPLPEPCAPGASRPGPRSLTPEQLERAISVLYAEEFADEDLPWLRLIDNGEIEFPQQVWDDLDLEPEEMALPLSVWAGGGAVGRALRGLPSGPELAAAVDRLTDGTRHGMPDAVLGDSLTDDDLLEVAAAAQRLAQYATAIQLRVLAAHADRQPAVGPDSECPGVAVTSQEAALACGTSRHQAESMINTQWGVQRLPVLEAMLRRGELDWAKARIVVDKVMPLRDGPAQAVAEAIAPDIVRLTRPALSERLDQLVAAADPEVFADAARQDRAGRRVTFRSTGRGMGQMTLTAPVEDTAALRAELDALTMAARQAQEGLRAGAGPEDAERYWTGPSDPDGRHPAATRADTLVDAVLNAGKDGGAPGSDPDTAPAVAATDAEETATEATDAPASDVPASFVRPTPERPARPGRADVVVLVPLSVLTGESEQPAQLEGHGVIPAQLARELAAGGTWRCAVVDDDPHSPTAGTLLGLGRSTFTPRYVPGPRTREFVRLRDGTCVFPGCRQPARRCDVDHRTPWHDGGPTCACNLALLCRFHHQLKQAGFTPRAVTGGLEWTTPGGRRYAHPTRTLVVQGPQPPPGPPPPVPEPPF